MSTTNPISAESRNTPQSSSTDFSSSLGQALFQQRIEAVLLQAKKATGADGVAVSLKDGDDYVCRASVGMAPEIGVIVKSGQGICGRCIAEAQAVVEQALDGDIKSVAAIPVMKGGQVFGFVGGFSLRSHGFPLVAVEELRVLADAIQNEIDPPKAVELNPDSDENEQELLSQFGIAVPAKSEETKQGFAEEDDSFLSELIQDVLGNAPSNAVHHEPAPQEPTPENILLEEPRVEAAPAFPARTTEEVLMQVVEQLPKPAAPMAAAAAAPALAPIPAPLVEEAEKKASAAALDSKKKKKKGWQPVAVPVEKIEPAREEASTVVETRTFQAEAAGSESALPAWTMPRIAAFASVAALALVLLVYFVWLRKPATAETKQVLASTPSTATAPAPVTNTPTTVDSKPTNTEPAAKDERGTQKRPQQHPIQVASSRLPGQPSVETVEPPTISLGSTAALNTPALPNRSNDVVFGGARSTGATPARVLNRVEPVYPAIARSMHLSGDVKMEAVIGTDGRVKTVRPLAGPNMLAIAAADALKKWRYDPAKQNGKAVESVVEVTMRFK